MDRIVRIALIVSHPIQHFCPQYASFAQNENVVFKVCFGSALGLRRYYDVNFKTEVAWDNLRLDRFDHVFLNGDKVIPSDSSIDSAHLDNALSEFKPDLIIAYGYSQKLQRRARAWALAHKVKLAYISDSESRHKRNWLKEVLKYFFIRQYFSRIEYFLTVGNANEEFYRKFGVKDEKMIRMHFPIDLEAYRVKFEDRSSLRMAKRKEYEIHDSEVVLSVVGKLVSWKNQDHIIDAMSALEEDGVYLTLLVIGSGEMLETWREKAKLLNVSKVHFTGFVDPADLPTYYAATDIYVHPASLEPHSIAVSEAIYMGCPVIISDRCGSYGETDDVQEGRNGLVYPYGNVQLLADVIRMLANSEKRIAFGAYSHSIAKEFQYRSHIEVLSSLVKRVRGDEN